VLIKEAVEFIKSKASYVKEIDAKKGRDDREYSREWGLPKWAVNNDVIVIIVKKSEMEE